MKSILSKAIKHITRQLRHDRKSGSQVTSLKSLTKQQDPHIIISLTSYGHRIEKTAPITIASLLRQTVLPDGIILWLSDYEKPSRELVELENHGLEIRFTEDIKSYKKLIPTLLDYPDSVIITVDDDMVYPETWLEKTLATFRTNPGAIVANRARMITVNDKRVSSYTDWPLLTDNNIESRFILPTGAGGVLYPPRSLDSRVVDKDLFMTLAPHADDLWFWAMAELNHTPRVLVNDGFSDTLEYELDNSNEMRLSIMNVDPNNKDNNDTQLSRILDRFPELYDFLNRDQI